LALVVFGDYDSYPKQSMQHVKICEFRIYLSGKIIC